MKRNHYVAILFTSVLLYILFTSSSGGRATAANSGNTGAPSESSTCVNCHNANTAYGTVTITIQVFQLGTTSPVTTYLPNTSYDMRVTVQNSAGSPVGYGFQMTALTTPSNLPLGGYSNLASNVKQKLMTSGTWNGRTYVEHSGVTANNQFNFRWTAPAAGSGAIRFYASGNAVNGNGGTSGDRSGVSTLTVQEAVPVSATATLTNPTCFGGQNGSIQLSVSGGTPPYNFLWNNNSESQNLLNIPAGAYSVTITDADNLSFSSQYTINQPSSLAFSTSVTNALTPFTNGTITFTAAGGTPPYRYFVNGEEIFSTTAEVAPGNINTSVVDANNCEQFGTALITVPNEYSVQSNVTPVLCFGGNTGSISLNILGGTPPYTIAWTDGFTGPLRTQLTAGTYDVTITDIHNYSIEQSFTISEPSSILATVTVQAPLCFNQAAEVLISSTGGTGPYIGTGTILLAPGDQTVTVQDAAGCASTTSFFIPNPLPLQAFASNAEVACNGGTAEIEVTAEGGTPPYAGVGVFSVNTPGISVYTVTDANGCLSTANSSVSATDAFTVSATTEPVSCAETCTGSAALIITDALEPITIVWEDGSEAQAREELCAGNYTIQVSDASGCEALVNITITEPTPLTFDITSTPILCAGDNALLQTTTFGGTPPYSVSWLNEAVTNPFEVPSGNWIISVTDANNCALSESITVTEPEEITIQETIQSVLCFGENTGSISVIPSGGTSPLSLVWSTGSITTEASLLSAGMYTVTVTDMNFCSTDFSFEVVESTEITIETVLFDIASDGTATLEVIATGGTAPFDYQWSDGQSGNTVSLAADGTFTVTVTDANDCSVTSETFTTPVTIEENITEDAWIYPNPAHEKLNVHSAIYPASTLTVYSPLGKKIYSTQEGAVDRTIDITQWPAGLYIISILHQGESRFYRVQVN